MTRPTILDRDEVAVVPVEPDMPMISAYCAKQEELGIEAFANGRIIFPTMLSASPHSSAWQEVREYVAGLERHVEELQAKINPETDCACSYDEPGTVCDAHSPRVRELEALAKEEGERGDHWFDLATYDVGGAPRLWKDRAETAETRIAALELRLAEAERVMQPFADRAARYDTIPGLISFDDSCELWQTSKNKGFEVDITIGDLRAARAWKEGK